MVRFHVNNPSYKKGTELEIPGIGLVANGDVLELTDAQVNALKGSGVSVPDAGDMYLYNEPKPMKVEELATDNLPGVEEIAEKERANGEKAAPKKQGDK